jgi:hypothetical protein
VFLHNHKDIDSKLDCLINAISSPEGNMSLITSDVYDIRWVQNIHCLFTGICEVNRQNVLDEISLQNVLWAVNEMALYRCLSAINFNNFSIHSLYCTAVYRE